MFAGEKINVPVLGLIENMSWFTPEKHPDEKYMLFGEGGGIELAKEQAIEAYRLGYPLPGLKRKLKESGVDLDQQNTES